MAGYGALLAVAGLGYLVASFVAMRRDSSDFLAFWGAGRAVLGGRPAAAYDLGAQAAIQAQAGFDAFFAFVNPPPFLFAVAPFAALPFPAAWIAWVMATYALWLGAALPLAPRWARVAVAAFPGALIAAGHAQNGLLTGALLVGGVALVDRRPLIAGALLGALVMKPHLAVLVPFWLAAGGRWRTFVATGASAAALCVLAWAAFGTATMLAYANSWGASAALLARPAPEFWLRMATVFGMARGVWPAGAALAILAVAIQAVVSVAALAAAMLAWRRMGDAAGSGALMLASTGLATPYLFNYDLPFLILPLVWLAQAGAMRGFRPWERAALVALYLAPFATRAAALPLGVNLMPVAMVVQAWLIWTRAAPRPVPEPICRPGHDPTGGGTMGYPEPSGPAVH